MLLADLGADVVFVERPEQPDPTRLEPGFFAALNRGKRAIALDLKTDEGRDAFLALCRDADVVLEGFRPGVVKRLGVDFETVRACQPEITYVSISSFGQDGRLRLKPAHDLIFLALGGLLSAFVDHGIAELAPGLSLEAADLVSGLYATIAVLLGVSSNPRGGFFDVAMFDSLAYTLAGRLGPLLNSDGASAGDIAYPSYGLFETSDRRWLALGIEQEDHFWRRLCSATGLTELAEITAVERRAQAPVLRARLAAAIGSRELGAWARALETADVPHAPVLTTAEAADQGQLDARGMIVVDSDGVRHLVQPIQPRPAPRNPIRAAPNVGEQTLEVLIEAGFTESEVESLLRSRALGVGSRDA